MNSRILKLLAAVAVITAPAIGGPLVASRVAASSNWVVHVDNDLFKSTKIGKLIRAQLVEMGVQKQIDDFARIFSFNPLDDIRGLTLYGTGSDKQKAAVVIDAVFDRPHILSLLKMNPEYEMVRHEGVDIHKWVDQDKKDPNDPLAGVTYAAFYDPNLAVLSPGLDAVKQAIDVLKGKDPNASSGVFGQGELKAKDAFIQIAANRIDELAGNQPQGQMVAQAKELGIAIGETDGKFFIDFGLTANNEEAAINIGKMIDGMVAFATMASQDKPELAQLAQQIKSTRVKDTIRIRFDADSEKLMTVIKQQWQQQAQAKNPK